MSWEQRRGRSYLYRKVREGGRVRSKYLGTGLLAQMSAEEDDEKRRQHSIQRTAARAARQAEAQIDRQLASVESAIAALTQAALSAAGYHRHKGQWRKRRREK
jgi:hypothetical protein